MKNYFKTFLVLICLSTSIYSQVNSVSLGISTGVGEIKSNAPSQTSFAVGGFVELSPSFWNGVDFRFDYTFMRKADYLFPDKNTERYYPSMHALSIKAITRQLLSEKFFLEKGIGPLFLNDQTFSDMSTWNYGVCGWFSLGLDIKNISDLPITLAIGGHFGLTFTNETPSYFIYTLQAQCFILK